jgi:hypothetical protein
VGSPKPTHIAGMVFIPHDLLRSDALSGEMAEFGPSIIAAPDGCYKKYELDSVDACLYCLRNRERTAIERTGARRGRLTFPGQTLLQGIHRCGCIGICWRRSSTRTTARKLPTL